MNEQVKILNFLAKFIGSKLDIFIPSWAQKLPNSLESAFKKIQNLEDGWIL